MDGRNNVPNFRRLKAIRERLERDIYNRSEIMDGQFLNDSPDRWQQANSYHAENERDQQTVDEIDWVLDYFRPTASPWPAWAWLVFGGVAAVALVLAILALVR